MIELLAFVILVVIGWVAFLIVAPIVLTPLVLLLEWVRHNDHELR